MQARGDTPESSLALGELCESYWTPVFRFLRREGRSEDEAKDLTQEFVARLLEKGGIEKVDPARGRFRSYLLGALKHFLSDARRDQNRQKRGGDVVIESIDDKGNNDTGAGLQIPDPAGPISDTYFDRQWALAVMERALDVLQSEFKAGKKEEQFEVLKPWLMGDTESLSQSEAATHLGMTTNAVKVAIHRMRSNFRKAVKSEIAQTVSAPEEVEEELRYLIEVLS